jgi:hypothetical protein
MNVGNFSFVLIELQDRNGEHFIRDFFFFS